MFSFRDGFFFTNARFSLSRGTLPSLDAIATADTRRLCVINPLCAIEGARKASGFGAQSKNKKKEKGKKEGKKGEKTYRADEPVARLGPGDDRGRGARALGVGHDDGLAALHGGHGGVGGAQVDTDDLFW